MSYVSAECDVTSRCDVLTQTARGDLFRDKYKNSSHVRLLLNVNITFLLEKFELCEEKHNHAIHWSSSLTLDVNVMFYVVLYCHVLIEVEMWTTAASFDFNDCFGGLDPKPRPTNVKGGVSTPAGN